METLKRNDNQGKLDIAPSRLKLSEDRKLYAVCSSFRRGGDSGMFLISDNCPTETIATNELPAISTDRGRRQLSWLGTRAAIRHIALLLCSMRRIRRNTSSPHLLRRVLEGTAKTCASTPYKSGIATSRDLHSNFCRFDLSFDASNRSYYRFLPYKLER